MKKMYVYVVGALMAMFGSVASAALPATIGTELTTIQTDALALADLVWPVVIAIFGSLVIFKLFKRYGNKI